MILDSEEQKKLLLELIAASNIPGKAIDVLHALLTAIREAAVK